VLLLVTLTGIAVPVGAQSDEGWSEARELAETRQMIEANGWDWEAGPTDVSALPPSERQKLLGLIPSKYDTQPLPGESVLETLPERDLPASWDWRTLGGTTPAKNQGGCGACWAFAAVGALESIYKITNGTQLLFSEQQCLSCNDYGEGCDGGQMTSCYEIWESFGACTQTCIPYTGNDSYPCTQDECPVEARIDGTTFVAYGETTLKTGIMVHPVAVTIYVTNPMFNYHSGCYVGPNGATNHAILLCGWDDSMCNGNGAWLIKNSWGPSWGMSGFGWIQFNTCSIGAGGRLLNYAPFPVARMAYASHTVLDGGNGALDPGETAPVSVTATNFGTGTATNVSGILRSLTAGVTVIDSVATFANVGTWASGTTGAPHFTVQVGSGLPAGTALNFELEVQSDQATDTSTFTAFASPVTVVHTNNFETGTAGWTHGATSGADDWRWGAPRGLPNHWDCKLAASGTKVFGNDLNETGTGWDGLYENSVANWLQSPVINCTGQYGVHLLFKRWLTVEQGIYDDARVLVNGTEVWHNPDAGHTQDQIWVPMALDISTLADNQASVQVKFDLAADVGLRFAGWNIDDFQIIALSIDGQPVSETPRAAPQFLAVRSFPNPSRPLTSLHLAIPVRADDARVDIFDASGRHVRSLWRGMLSQGMHQLTWNGTDETGQGVPAGTYYCRAVANGESNVTKILRVEWTGRPRAPHDVKKPGGPDGLPGFVFAPTCGNDGCGRWPGRDPRVVRCADPDAATDPA
jgi:C1A family cysteine protease